MGLPPTHALRPFATTPRPADALSSPTSFPPLLLHLNADSLPTALPLRNKVKREDLSLVLRLSNIAFNQSNKSRSDPTLAISLVW